MDKAEVGDEASYTVTITNGRLTERAELGRGHAPTDEQVRHEITQRVRRDTWTKIKERSESATTIMWIAHPS